MSYLQDVTSAQNCQKFYGTVSNFPESEPFTDISDLHDSEGNSFTSAICFTQSKAIRKLGLKRGDKVRFRASVVLHPTPECIQILDTDPNLIHGYEPEELIRHHFKYVTRAEKIEKYPWEREMEECMNDLMESLK